MPGSHTMSVEQILNKLRQRADEPRHRNPHRQRPASRTAVQLLHGSAERAEGRSGPAFT